MFSERASPLVTSRGRRSACAAPAACAPRDAGGRTFHDARSSTGRRHTQNTGVHAKPNSSAVVPIAGSVIPTPSAHPSLCPMESDPRTSTCRLRHRRARSSPRPSANPIQGDFPRRHSPPRCPRRGDHPTLTDRPTPVGEPKPARWCKSNPPHESIAPDHALRPIEHLTIGKSGERRKEPREPP